MACLLGRVSSTTCPHPAVTVRGPSRARETRLWSGAWTPSCCPCPARPGATWRPCTSSATSPPRSPTAYVAQGLHPRLSYFPGPGGRVRRGRPGPDHRDVLRVRPVAGRGGAARGLGDRPRRRAWSRPAGPGWPRPWSGSSAPPDVGEALEIARDVCAGLTPQGRPLYAAHADLPWPDDDLLALWHAATLIREHRGDGHLSVLQARRHRPGGGDRARRHRTPASTRFLRKTRGWSDEEYDAATDRLRERGWLDADGGFTDEGRAAAPGASRTTTDRLAVEGWARGRGRADRRGCTSWSSRCARR